MVRSLARGARRESGAVAALPLLPVALVQAEPVPIKARCRRHYEHDRKVLGHDRGDRGFRISNHDIGPVGGADLRLGSIRISDVQAVID